MLQLINMESFQVENKSLNNSGGLGEEAGLMPCSAAAKPFFTLTPPSTVGRAMVNTTCGPCNKWNTYRGHATNGINTGLKFFFFFEGTSRIRNNNAMRSFSKKLRPWLEPFSWCAGNCGSALKISFFLSYCLPFFFLFFFPLRVFSPIGPWLSSGPAGGSQITSASLM